MFSEIKSSGISSVFSDQSHVFLIKAYIKNNSDRSSYLNNSLCSFPVNYVFVSQENGVSKRVWYSLHFVCPHDKGGSRAEHTCSFVLNGHARCGDCTRVPNTVYEASSRALPLRTNTFVKRCANPYLSPVSLGFATEQNRRRFSRSFASGR